MQISCQFASDFFEKRLHYCTTIALQKSCDKPANRRAASDEKPTPVLPSCCGGCIDAGSLAKLALVTGNLWQVESSTKAEPVKPYKLSTQGA